MPGLWEKCAIFRAYPIFNVTKQAVCYICCESGRIVECGDTMPATQPVGISLKASRLPELVDASRAFMGARLDPAIGDQRLSAVLETSPSTICRATAWQCGGATSTIAVGTAQPLISSGQ